jgi:NADPH:quinone reductase-like Zn-dependent oxidoreductase
MLTAGPHSSGGNWTGMGRQFRALAVSPFLRQRLTMVTPRQRSADLERLTALIIEAGKVTPSIGATYPLDEVPEAMRHIECGAARGKIAIVI